MIPVFMEKSRLREVILLAEGTAELPEAKGYVLKTTQDCVWSWTKLWLRLKCCNIQS